MSCKCRPPALVRTKCEPASAGPGCHARAKKHNKIALYPPVRVPLLYHTQAVQRPERTCILSSSAITERLPWGTTADSSLSLSCVRVCQYGFHRVPVLFTSKSLIHLSINLTEGVFAPFLEVEHCRHFLRTLDTPQPTKSTQTPQ